MNLETLGSKTEQEVFDYVATHLLTQMRRSSVGNDCLYRSGELKCAAGCLIADDEYNVSYEGLAWGELVMRGVAPKDHEDLIVCLQSLHDYGDVENWADRLIGLAEDLKLDVPSCLK